MYVLYKGRVDRPTIFSSWASVHPRVTGVCGAEFKEVNNLEEARASMKAKGIKEYDEVIRSTVHGSHRKARGKYYAVALGKTTGIFEDWGEVENATKGVKYACQQRFDTESEAKEFIDDWNEAFADIWRQEIRDGLKDGWRVKSLDLDLASVLTKRSNEANAESDLVSRLNQLEVSKLAR
ncbi:uncharacterized protein N7496_010172 [Penicillium cataractarum]|uniref:Ribonuclease H1 N-terminal domain-containing protein n=1 Tax=Penicillium cataractarum TaxID=2100454 RepID=A0A9W9RT03_9EURO|nr:uncharacterized protein N7496_010172 [Penicillium cataractarum]KAJ5364459.1 hypothetical protein N7496_010172 [Penicillium cataractarum]